MTFKKLFEKLRRSGLNCGVAAHRLTEMKDGKEVQKNYEFLRGFLFGLNTARLITNDELDELHDILNNFF